MYEEVKQKFRELEEKLADPEITNDISQLSQVSQEHAYYKKIINSVEELEEVNKNLEENKRIIKEENEDD